MPSNIWISFGARGFSMSTWECLLFIGFYYRPPILYTRTHTHILALAMEYSKHSVNNLDISTYHVLHGTNYFSLQPRPSSLFFLFISMHRVRWFFVFSNVSPSVCVLRWFSLTASILLLRAPLSHTHTHTHCAWWLCKSERFVQMMAQLNESWDGLRKSPVGNQVFDIAAN